MEKGLPQNMEGPGMERSTYLLLVLILAFDGVVVEQPQLDCMMVKPSCSPSATAPLGNGNAWKCLMVGESV